MRKSPLLPIFLIVSVDVLGLTIILPLLPFYAEKFGASPAVVGLLVSTYALCQLVAGPILGRLSDHMGRRPLLLVSQLGTFIGFLILAYANALWVIFVSRIIDGLTAGNLSLAQAYISDVTKPEERAKSFALIGIAFGMGFLIGPGISGFLSQFSYQYPIFAAAALSATSILSTYFLLPSTAPATADSETPRKFTVLDWGNYLRHFRDPALAPLLWHTRLLAPLGVLLPVGMQIQFPVEQHSSISVCIGQKDPDLAVGDLACRSCILGCNAHRLFPLFEKSGLINHQHCFRVGQVRQDVLLQVVAHLISIPVGSVEQALHPIRRRFSRQLG